MKTIPLAERIRPESLDDVVGQQHLLAKDKLLYKMISSSKLSNMIFCGESGTGKTTVANIAAKASNRTFYKLNATNATLADIRSVFDNIGSLAAQNGILLYLDEIQNFNKKQQQSLLEFIENGDVVLIASTTENPYFYIYNALLSRSTVFEFKPLGQEDIIKALRRAAGIISEDIDLEVVAEEDVMRHFADMCGGDLRKALNALELAAYNTSKSDGKVVITLDLAEQSSQKQAMRYDKLGDNHYNILSAFQKSIRGSDPDAAVHYLARLVAAGDLISICRRLLVIASEDIGLAYPLAAVITKACVDSALQLGFPEARIPLAEAVVLLATAPKSNSAYKAIDAALFDVNNKNCGEVPKYILDTHSTSAKMSKNGNEYLYPHDFHNSFVEQSYMPENIKGARYYEYGNNKFEKGLEEYWGKIKGTD